MVSHDRKLVEVIARAGCEIVAAAVIKLKFPSAQQGYAMPETCPIGIIINADQELRRNI